MEVVSAQPKQNKTKQNKTKQNKINQPWLSLQGRYAPKAVFSYAKPNTSF
jgi:hypothetical protein